MTLRLTFPQSHAPTLPRPGVTEGMFTSPTFTATGRAWRIVVVLTEHGASGWKPQVRMTARKPAECDPWEDWRASVGFNMPRAVRRYGDEYMALCAMHQRRARAVD